jgi:hypothetical protein
MLQTDAVDPYFAALCLALTGSAFAALRVQEPRAARALLLSAALLLACALAVNIAFKLQYVPWGPVAPTRPPLLSDGLQVWVGDGAVAILALLVAWRVAAQESDRTAASANGVGSLLLCAGSAVVCVALSLPAWRTWTDFQYPARLQALVAPWRALLPPHAEGIWPEAAMGGWYLLERASYYASIQAAGDIFSRAKAMEVQRRGDLILAALNATQPRRETAAQRGVTAAHPGRSGTATGGPESLNEKGLAMLCENSELNFYVSWSRLDLVSAGAIVPNPARPQQQLHLYRCADIGKQNQ